MAKSGVICIVPARMAASRLPGKPLADIGGRPMIVRVMERAAAAGIGPVVVATDSTDIKSAVEAAGGRAIMTRADHPSGSDRIFEALNLADPDGQAGIVVNVQGDLPTLEPADLRGRARPARRSGRRCRDVGRRDPKARRAHQPERRESGWLPVTPTRLRALYFTRATAPAGDGPLYHHIGLYAYRRAALARFVALPPSPLEIRERLEQLRLLEAGMRIDVTVVNSVPLGVDTPEDLEAARAAFARV